MGISERQTITVRVYTCDICKLVRSPTTTVEEKEAAEKWNYVALVTVKEYDEERVYSLKLACHQCSRSIRDSLLLKDPEP